MKLRDLILELASIDNEEYLPQRALLDFDVKFCTKDGSPLETVLSIYCDEKKQKICIDLE